MNKKKERVGGQSKSFSVGVMLVGMYASWYPLSAHLFSARTSAFFLAVSYLLLEMAISINSLAVNMPATPIAFFATFQCLFICEVLL